MSEYCRFCGKKLVDGKCDCREFKTGFSFDFDPKEYKHPFFVPGFKYLDFSSISAFITSMREQKENKDAALRQKNPYERNTPIVPGCVEQEENEVVIKQYDIARLRTRLKFMKAEGRLQVTNKRILFRAAGTSPVGNVLQQHQYALEELTGIEMHTDYRFSFLNLLFTLLFFSLASMVSTAHLLGSFSRQAEWMGFILGVVTLSISYVVNKRHWLKLFMSMIGYGSFLFSLIALGKIYVRRGELARAGSPDTSLSTFPTPFEIIAFITLASLLVVAFVTVIVNTIIVCYVPNLVIRIKTKGAAGAVVIARQRTLFSRGIADEYSGFMEVMPWKDTVMAMNELGPMIDDLQKHGDYAAAKWAK
jgi:hypothetical protein